MSPIAAVFLGLMVGWFAGWSVHKAICDHFHGRRR